MKTAEEWLAEFHHWPAQDPTPLSEEIRRIQADALRWALDEILYTSYPNEPILAKLKELESKE